MIKILNEIIQIQAWFKENIGPTVDDGDYIVPINGEDWNVTIIDNKVWLKDKMTQMK